MSTIQTRLLASTLALLLLAVGTAYWSGRTPPASAAEPKESNVNKLLQERLAVLKEFAALTRKAHESGYVPVTSVHDANEAVFRAELDLAETVESRIAILEKLLAEAKLHEEHVSLMSKAGSGQAFMVLRAKAHRLDAEIALEREKMKRPPK